MGASTEKITENVSQILNDDATHRRMREAPNPYGDGTASEKILDTILDSYNQGKLEIKPPEEISTNHLKKLFIVDESISVAEFENKNPEYRINLVFDGENPCYPHPDLSLKGKSIIVTY